MKGSDVRVVQQYISTLPAGFRLLGKLGVPFIGVARSLEVGGEDCKLTGVVGLPSAAHEAPKEIGGIFVRFAREDDLGGRGPAFCGESEVLGAAGAKVCGGEVWSGVA